MGENLSQKNIEEDILTGRVDVESVKTESEKCQSCGSNMVFSPDKQKLECPHCGSTKELQKTLVSELQLISALDSSRMWTKEETSVFNCENCGAKVILTASETAKLCPFCGTAHVTKTEELSGLKPNGLIPFAFDGDKAVEYSKAWAKKRFFAPRKFKKNISAENVNGVYMPCFTFDSRTTSTYVGRIGKRHTRVVGSGKNRRTETYVVWRTISGTYYHNFDDVLVTAGSKLNQKQLDKISPYNTNSGKLYSEEYMLGFMAYHYDDEITDCWASAKKTMDGEIESGILSQYFYDVFGYLNVSTTHEQVTYKYVMLPTYVGNYKFNKKTYNFYVNGETGKVWGKTPKSPLKIIGLILGIAAAITGIVLLCL